jgi:imidazolonepropionase-like amidohydrolase
MRVRPVVGLLAALAWPVWAAAARTEVYAIVGARVVTVSGATLERGTVVMTDGVIQAVGADVTPPAGARVLDGTGLTVTPGLIDGFSSIGLPSPAPRSAGASAAASPPPLAPQALALDRIRATDAVKARDQGITTALVVPREGVLPGRSVLINLSGGKVEAMAVRQPFALHLHLAATAGQQYPGSLMGTVAYTRQALLDAARYRDEWAAYERAPRGKKRPQYDPALAAWEDVIAKRLPLVVTASRENDLLRILALADEFNVRVAAAGAPQAYRLAELVKKRKLPLLVTVNFDPPALPAFGGDDEDKIRADIDAAEKNPAALHKAGVPFALVSGYAPNFLAGVRKAIERGLPREAALRAVTLGAAEALGIQDRTGSLEAGKIANVVAWAGEPMAKDVKVKMLFVDGQLFEPEDRPSPSPSPASSPSPTPSPASEVRQ